MTEARIFHTKWHARARRWCGWYVLGPLGVAGCGLLVGVYLWRRPGPAWDYARGSPPAA